MSNEKQIPECEREKIKKIYQRRDLSLFDPEEVGDEHFLFYEQGFCDAIREFSLSGESCSESIDGQKVYEAEEVFKRYAMDNNFCGTFIEYLSKSYKLIKSTTQNIKE